MVLKLKEYTMASLSYKLSYTTLISPKPNMSFPLCFIKNETPPSSLSLFVLSSPHIHTHFVLSSTHTHFVSSPPAHQLRFFCSLRLKIVKLEVDLLCFASLLSHPIFPARLHRFSGDSR